MNIEASDNSKQGNRVLLAGIAVLVAAICLVAVYKAKPILFPPISRSASVDPLCDLRSAPCVSPLGDDVKISFSIEPPEIPLVKPLKLRVIVEGLESNKVEVDFSGVDMNMGFNRVGLQQISHGLFEGDGMLPVCVRDAMEWEARVLISTSKGIVSAPYRFVTVRPGMELP